MQYDFEFKYQQAIHAKNAALCLIVPAWQRYGLFPYSILSGALSYYLGVKTAVLVGWENSEATANIAGLLVFLLSALLLLRIGVTARRALYIRELRSCHPETLVEFSVEPTALVWTQSNSEMRLGYRDIDTIFVTGGLVCFISGGNALYVPAEALDGPNGVRAFVRDIHPRLSETAKQWSLRDRKIQRLLKDKTRGVNSDSQ